MALEIISIVLTPITELGKFMFGALKSQIHYLTRYGTNIENLNSQMTRLLAKRQDIQNSVHEAEKRLEEPRQIVLDWLETTGKMEEEMRVLDEEFKATNRCLKGLCPDLSSRLRISKQAVKKMEIVNDLEEQGNFTTVSRVPDPPSIEFVRMDSLVDIASRDLVMDEVRGALQNESIQSIGLHGMGGIGKTTLAININNELHGSQLFKTVIMVTVSRDPDLKIIQDNIADRLGFKLRSESSAFTRAHELFKRLKAEKTVLIILDDVWVKLKVTDIGLPLGSEHMDCKVIITTRNREVCEGMKVQTIIKMEPLMNEESWVLFKEKAGNVALLPNLQPTAERIVRRCKGSPLAIVTLASALREAEEYEWNNALRVLENPAPCDLNGIMPEVITSLRYSYDHLPNSEIKLCFLFCCLYPEDYSIYLPKLRDYGIGEGFLHVNGTLEDAFNKLLSFVKKLKNCCLLLDGDREMSVKMHDVVRDVALLIASDDENGFLVNVGGGLRNMPETEKLKGYKQISLMNNLNVVLSVPYECPQLRSLLIRGNVNLSMDEDRLFQGTKALRVLDLIGNFPWDRNHTLLSVPQSLSYLTSLRTLYLANCDLSNKVFLLGGMKKLEVLSLYKSKIGKLPKEIGNLINLRFLDLSGAVLSTITPNVISRLSNLEELFMWNTFTDWDTNGSDGGPNASFTEVASLTHLSLLEIRVRDKRPGDILCSWSNMKRFHVTINDVFTNKHIRGDNVRNCCDLYLNEVNMNEHWVSKLFTKVKKMNLKYCYGFKSVADLDTVGGFKKLEDLMVCQCNEIEYLIEVEESKKAPQDCFVTLKVLRVTDIERMKRLFQGQAPSTRFLGQLRIIKVENCPQIKNIFSSNLLSPAQRLGNLQELEVHYCHSLQEVFNTEEVGATPTTDMLSGLRSIELSYLPKMTSIWKGVIPIGSLQDLRKLEVKVCHGLKYLLLSYMTEGLQNLERLHINDCDAMEKMILSEKEEEERTSSSPTRHMNSSKTQKSPSLPTFPNLQVLRIFKCKLLKNLFSFRVARDLQQLKSLHITHCNNIKEIFGFEEEEEIEAVDHRDFLPQLESLELVGLHSLTSLYHGSLPISCPLKVVKVVKCPNLKKLPLEIQTTTCLQKIHGEIEWFEGLEWEDESLKSCFQRFFVATRQNRAKKKGHPNQIGAELRG